MNTIIENVKSQIQDMLNNAIKSAIAKAEIENISDYNINLEEPREKANGDFSSNIAMLLTKQLRKPPRVIADIICNNIDISGTAVSKCEVAGAGFINFYLDNSWLYAVLDAIEAQNIDYGKVDIGKGQKYMVEFVSANPTGPMHMGNARGGALGDCLAEVLSWAGYDVTREFYLNDAGNQIEKFANSLESRYLQIWKGDDAILFPEDGYQGEDIKDHAKAFSDINGNRYVDLDGNERRNALVEYALGKNVEALKIDLANYRINFDVWFKESALYESGEVDSVVEAFKESGYTYELDGALWFKTTAFGGDKDDVLVRSNGIPTYFTADVAYHRNKFVTRGFDRVITILGADHYGHVARMKNSLTALGIDKEKLDIIIIQLVRLMSGGEVVRMSKRTGRSLTLNDLLDEIGIDAARFFFNTRGADTHMDFDLDLAVSQSSENPVFYVQYAHARICSILRLLKDENVLVKAVKDIDVTLLKEPQELELLKKLADFPEEIKAAALALEPNRLTRYCIDLSALFHAFYGACKVRSEDTSLMDARVKLAECVRIVLSNVMRMLSVSTPEKM